MYSRDMQPEARDNYVTEPQWLSKTTVIWLQTASGTFAKFMAEGVSEALAQDTHLVHQ